MSSIKFRHFRSVSMDPPINLKKKKKNQKVHMLNIRRDLLKYKFSPEKACPIQCIFSLVCISPPTLGPKHNKVNKISCVGWLNLTTHISIQNNAYFIYVRVPKF